MLQEARRCMIHNKSKIQKAPPSAAGQAASRPGPSGGIFCFGEEPIGTIKTLWTHLEPNRTRGGKLDYEIDK